MRRFFLIPLLLVALNTIGTGEERTKLRVLVMDPLASQLSCDCVDGVGRRDYVRLGRFLSAKLSRPIDVLFDESLPTAHRRFGRALDVVIGKQTVVEADVRRTKSNLSLLARLTDRMGRTDIRGAVIVQSKSPFKSPADLKGKRVCLGPQEDRETHNAGRKLLSKVEAVKFQVMRSIEEAVYAVDDGDAVAAVIPDYMRPLLEGCGKIEQGSLRTIAETEAVPGIAAFVADSLANELKVQIAEALEAVATDRQLLTAIESRRGFVELGQRVHQLKPHVAGASPFVFGNAPPQDLKPPAKLDATSWPDWRGPRRDGLSADVPRSLPKSPEVMWTADVTGPAMAGIAVADGYVVVADKDAALRHDIIRCFDADTGARIWTLTYPAPTKVDYTNAPRANPLIHEGLVYTQGALGDLHCIEVATGRVVWRMNLLREFDAKPLTWGSSSPPLIIGEKLITNPGAKQASLVALNRKTGEVIWKTPGHAAGYAAFIAGTFGGKRQIVGYDVAGLAGWDPETGKRLWEVIPRGGTDFHVGTPLAVEGKILVATENNATRLYGFDKQGKAIAQPIATNEDLAPDSCTPVVIGGRVFASAFGELFCLDRKRKLKTIWSELDDLYYDHTNLIAGNGRVLIWTTTGDLVLIRADVDKYEVVAKLRPFAGNRIETMSHPALVGDRIFLRSTKQLMCLSLRER